MLETSASEGDGLAHGLMHRFVAILLSLILRFGANAFLSSPPPTGFSPASRANKALDRNHGHVHVGMGGRSCSET